MSLDWVGLAAHGRYDLRLSPEELFAMTPREHQAILDCRRADLIRQEFGPALVASIISNVYGRKGRPPRKPSDFMPSLIASRPRRIGPISPAESKARMKAIADLMSGRGGARSG